MPSGPASVLPAAVGPRTYALPVSSGSVAVRDRIRAERASPNTVRRPGILKKMHRSGEVRHPAAIELTTRLHGLPADRVGWGVWLGAALTSSSIGWMVRLLRVLGTQVP